jgi:exopolyphosphatase/guanosine-5'-triphosphate,3'-diphosphate pyrophosphatase
MRLAALDVGSNSIHLLIVRVLPDHSYEPVYRDKAMVRLGARVFASGELTRASQKRAMVVLERYAQVVRKFEVDRVIGVATSAVREAENGIAFLRDVRVATGLKIDRISGTEEARLVAAAVAAMPPFDRGEALVIDIGGGSTELAWIENQAPRQVQSVKTGAVRLSEEAPVKNRPGKKGLRGIQRVATEKLSPFTRRLKKKSFHYVVGTSGSIVCLGMLAARRAGQTLVRGQTFVVARDDLRKELNYLATLSLDERRIYMGEQAGRADIILPGGAVLLSVLDQLENDEIHIPDRSIRDGMIVDYIRQRLEATPDDHIVRLTRMVAASDEYPYDPHAVREANILSLARRYHYDAPHANQVMRISAQIFDATAELHELGAEEKFYLEAAALLHDIGQFIAYSQHHKHSMYLIMNGGLSGFSDREIQIVANVARYHRKGGPRTTHPEFAEMPPEDRRVVRRLAAILRVADGLDYGHLSSVERVRVDVKSRRVVFHATCRRECRSEIDRALGKSDLFAAEFARRVEFKSRRLPQADLAAEKTKLA